MSEAAAMRLSPAVLKKLLRFVATGGLVTGVHYAVVVAMMDWGGANQVLANIIAFIIANILSFFINARLVFAAAGTRAQFLKFFSVSLAGFGMTLAVSSFGQAQGWHRGLTVIVLAGFLAFVSFIGHHVWTFKVTPSPAAE